MFPDRETRKFTYPSKVGWFPDRDTLPYVITKYPGGALTLILHGDARAAGPKLTQRFGANRPNRL